ncbi:MAG: hypothetical protein AAF517_07890, partial [Planctomycetota bacterium]
MSVALPLFALTLALISGCNTLASGRKYTLAKVDRDFRLVEPHRLLEQLEEDRLDEVNPTGNWGITLNGGFLPYLDAVENPEVVIFVSVRIREQDEPEDSLLWEKVYLNSELEDDRVAMNKDSFLPRDDIPLLPPIVYEGQDIFVQIRVIELDQDDNERTRQLVSTAASAAVAFRPETGIAVSVFQTALTFLTENNADDIEFQYDFALSQSPGPIRYGGREYDNVLNPRVGKYAVVKTEHRHRTNLPQGYLPTAHHGLRFFGAEVLKWGTLGVLNWSTAWAGSDTDWYHWLLQYPLTIPEDSWRAPTWAPKSDPHLKCHDRDTLCLIGGRLFGKPPTEETQQSELHTYEDQGYLIFSINHANNGVDVKSLSELAKQQKIVEQLTLATGQLATDQSAKLMGFMTTALENLAKERSLRKKYLADLSKVDKEDVGQIEEVEQRYQNELETLQLSSTNQQSELSRFIEERAKLRASSSQGREEEKVQSSQSHQGSVHAVRKTENGKHVAKFSYVLSPEDTKDGRGVRFEACPAKEDAASTLRSLPGQLSWSARGATVEASFGPPSKTIPTGEYQLIV